MGKFFDVVFWPIVFLLGIIGAVLRTVYWGGIVTPAVLLTSLLVGVGSIPKPIVPLLCDLGGESLERDLLKIVQARMGARG